MREIKTRAWRWMVVALIATVFGVVTMPSTTQAAVGINSQISFQGKVVTSTGVNIPDGNYNMQFKIYQDGNGCVGSGTAPCGGTLKWTESRLVSNTQSVSVTAGTFQVNLGSVNPLTGIDFNQDTLWLSMNIGGTTSTASPTYDGEMTPFIRLTSVPYAVNAGLVDGLSASQLVQLAPTGQQSGIVNVSGNITTNATLQAATLDTPSSGTLTVGSTNTTGITLNKNTSITSGQTLSIGGQQVFSGTGLLQSAALSGSYSNALTLSNVGNSIAGTLTGSYAGTAVAAQYGGTGNTSYTIGDLLYASGTTALSKLAAVAAGSCLKSNGVGAAPVYGSCNSTTPTLQAAYNGGSSITQTAAGSISFTSGTTVPSADQFIIDNTASTGVTTAGVNAESIKYRGGAAAVEGSGLRVDFIPGTTTGGTWSGLRIVADATGPVSGVTAYGIKLEGPTSQGAGQEEGLYIGSGWDVGLDIASGGIQMTAQADPATPTAGNLRLYAKSIAGRVLPKWVGPSGVDTPVQANFGFNRIAMSSPSGTGSTVAATFTYFGSNGLSGGSATPTFTTATMAATNLLSSVRRTTFKTPATASAWGYMSGGPASVWRGNAAGLGGFYYTTRFGFNTVVSGGSMFVGLAKAVPTANADPTTSNATDKVGLAMNSNTGNLTWINNLTGTTPSTSDLGTSFAVNTTSLYELVIFSPPNGSSITYRVRNISTGAVTADTTVSTNIPANTSFLTPLSWVNNSTAATATGMDSTGWYLESDN